MTKGRYSDEKCLGKNEGFTFLVAVLTRLQLSGDFEEHRIMWGFSAKKYTGIRCALFSQQENRIKPSQNTHSKICSFKNTVKIETKDVVNHIVFICKRDPLGQIIFLLSFLYAPICQLEKS